MLILTPIWLVLQLVLLVLQPVLFVLWTILIVLQPICLSCSLYARPEADPACPVAYPLCLL